MSRSSNKYPAEAAVAIVRAMPKADIQPTMSDIELSLSYQDRVNRLRTTKIRDLCASHRELYRSSQFPIVVRLRNLGFAAETLLLSTREHRDVAYQETHANAIGIAATTYAFGKIQSQAEINPELLDVSEVNEGDIARSIVVGLIQAYPRSKRMRRNVNLFAEIRNLEWPFGKDPAKERFEVVHRPLEALSVIIESSTGKMLPKKVSNQYVP